MEEDAAMKTDISRRGFLKKAAFTGAAAIGADLASGGISAALASSRKGVKVPPKNLPVALETDVVVVGGGPGGFAAALRAARMGARVVLIEKCDMPGAYTPRTCRDRTVQASEGLTPS